MNNRELMTKILEHWYSIDSVLFNDHSKYCIREGSKFREYVTLKGAMLSSLYEFYQHIKYQPIYEKEILPTNLKSLVENAKHSAIYSKKISSKILNKENVKQSLKNKIIKESKEKKIKDFKSFSDKVINEKFNQMSLDNILIGIPIIECSNMNACKDIKGEILRESYILMRNNLVDLAMSCKLNIKK